LSSFFSHFGDKFFSSHEGDEEREIKIEDSGFRILDFIYFTIEMLRQFANG